MPTQAPTSPRVHEIPPTPVVDIAYEEISEVPLPPNITVEEGEITTASSNNLSVLFVGQVQSPIANRTVVSEEQSIVVVEEINARRSTPAKPKIQYKSPFIRKLSRKSGIKPLPVKMITKYKNRSICHAKRVEERSFNWSLKRNKKRQKKGQTFKGQHKQDPKLEFSIAACSTTAKWSPSTKA